MGVVMGEDKKFTVSSDAISTDAIVAVCQMLHDELVFPQFDVDNDDNAVLDGFLTPILELRGMDFAAGRLLGQAADAGLDPNKAVLFFADLLTPYALRDQPPHSAGSRLKALANLLLARAVVSGAFDYGETYDQSNYSFESGIANEKHPLIAASILIASFAFDVRDVCASPDDYGWTIGHVVEHYARGIVRALRRALPGDETITGALIERLQVMVDGERR